MTDHEKPETTDLFGIPLPRSIERLEWALTMEQTIRNRVQEANAGKAASAIAAITNRVTWLYTSAGIADVVRDRVDDSARDASFAAQEIVHAIRNS